MSGSGKEVKSFLLKYLEDNNVPFVVSHLDDKIYLKEAFEDNPDFIEIRGKRYALEEGEDIKGEENLFCDEGYIKKVSSEMEEKIEKLKEQQKARVAKDDQLLVINFVNYFIDNWLKDNILSSGKSNHGSFQDLPDIQINSYESSSLLKRALIKDNSFLFIRQKCFRLVEKPGASPIGERIVLKGRNYWPQFESTAKAFDKRYLDTIQKEYKKKVDLFYEKELEMKIEQETKLQKKETLITHKENPTKAAGFIKIGKEYYVYINKNSPDNRGYFKVPHAELQKTFGWFPPCKLGLCIIAEDKMLKYDFNSKENEINIKILHPLPYTHPAVRDDDNPFLCLRAGNFDYKGLRDPFSWKDRKKFFKIVKGILKHASYSIEAGFAHAAKTRERDSDGKIREKDYESHTYHGGMGASKFKEYEMDKKGISKKPIGWADKILKKEMKK